MINFYLISLVLSAVLLALDFVLRCTEKIRCFGLEKRFYHFEVKTIPLEKLLPVNLTVLLFAVVVFSAAGLICEALGFGVWLSLPCGVFFSLAGCFILQQFILKIPEKLGEKLGDFDLSGMEGVCTEAIRADGYGRVKLTHGGRAYTLDAVSANESVIAEGEKVVLILFEQNVCFVERLGEVYDILNEKSP